MHTSVSTSERGIDLSIDAGIAHIAIRNPQKRNALSSDMYRMLVDALARSRIDRDVYVVLITGDEKQFSSGNDISDFLRHPPFGPTAPVWRFISSLAMFPKPVVAAVAGPAVGIGTTMLLHCDVVYAADTATFALPFCKLGLVPEAGASLLIPRLFGHAGGSELLLTGERFDAERALRAGLVSKVYPVEELFAKARAVAEQIATLPSKSVRATKALIRDGRSVAVNAAVRFEMNVLGDQLRSTETTELLRRVAAGTRLTSGLTPSSDSSSPQNRLL